MHGFRQYITWKITVFIMGIIFITGYMEGVYAENPTPTPADQDSSSEPAFGTGMPFGGINLSRMVNVDELLRQLKDPDWQVRARAAKGLGRAKEDRIVEPLIKALNDEYARVRLHALRSLALTGDPRAKAPIMRMLDDPDLPVRQQAVEVLRLFFDDTAVEGLKKALNDADTRVRATAAKELFGLVSPYMSDVKQMAHVFRKTLADENEDPKTRILCAEALGIMQDRDSYDILVKAAKSNDEKIREAATLALGQLADPRSFFLLLDLMKDPSPLIAVYAVNGLKELQDPRTIEYLIPLLLNNPDMNLIPSLIETLGSVSDDWGRFPVSIVSFFPVPVFRLGEKGESRATYPIVTVMIDNSSPQVIGAAAVALKRIGDKRAIPYLRMMIGRTQKWIMKKLIEDAIKAIAGTTENAESTIFE